MSRPQPLHCATRLHASGWHRLVKEALGRTLERAVAAVLLVVSAPVLVLLAIAVLGTLGAPVLVRRARVMQDGTTVEVLTFRAPGPDRRLGRLLRRHRLDELPQLWNVVRGELRLGGQGRPTAAQRPLSTPI